MSARCAPATSQFPSTHPQTCPPALVLRLSSWPTTPATARLDRSTTEPRADAPLSTAQAATATEPACNASLATCSAETAVSIRALSPTATPATPKVNALPALLDYLPALMALLVYLAPISLDARAANPPKIAQSALQA